MLVIQNRILASFGTGTLAVELGRADDKENGEFWYISIRQLKYGRNIGDVIEDKSIVEADCEIILTFQTEEQMIRVAAPMFNMTYEERLIKWNEVKANNQAEVKEANNV